MALSLCIHIDLCRVAYCLCMGPYGACLTYGAPNLSPLCCTVASCLVVLGLAIIKVTFFATKPVFLILQILELIKQISKKTLKLPKLHKLIHAAGSLSIYLYVRTQCRPPPPRHPRLLSEACDSVSFHAGRGSHAYQWGTFRVGKVWVGPCTLKFNIAKYLFLKGSCPFC